MALISTDPIEFQLSMVLTDPTMDPTSRTIHSGEEQSPDLRSTTAPQLTPFSSGNLFFAVNIHLTIAQEMITIWSNSAFFNYSKLTNSLPFKSSFKWYICK